MKLSKRGKDYLKASLAGVIIGSIFDVRLILALCFTLVIAAAISEIILWTATQRNIQIVYENKHISCFKGGEAFETITIVSRSRRFVRVTVSSLRGPEGVEATVDREDPNSIRFAFRPKYAGRFMGLVAEFELRDPLELFAKKIEIREDDFTIDCYPVSLLREIRTARPITIALGERIGRTHGSGQEFYAIDEYHSSIERKNIFWKKIAAMPDERLLVKTRESNIPKALTVGFIRTASRGVNELEWMDLACEGVALVGKTILSVGCDVRLLFSSEGRVNESNVQELPELSEAIMQLSRSELAGLPQTSAILSKSDICVTGLMELEEDLLATAIAKKPTLIIQDEMRFPGVIGDMTVIFNGHQDVSGLVTRVVGR